jgi:hypothetical protein
MPDFRQAHINPNDGMTGGFAHKKKQYHAINQHYISHNAVMPPQDTQNWAPHYNRYQELPLKPNQMSFEHSKYLFDRQIRQ